MLYIPRYEIKAPPPFGTFKTLILENGFTLIEFKEHVSVKLEHIAGHIPKAETISDKRFLIRMDLSQFLHGVFVI